MAIGFKVIVPIAGVIAGGGIIPLALWQTGTLKSAEVSIEQASTTHSESQGDVDFGQGSSALGELYPEEEGHQSSIFSAETVQKNNCTVNDNSLEKDTFSFLEIDEGNYTLITCENTGNDLTGTWKGFFPNSVFTDTLSPDTQFEIRTKNPISSGKENFENYHKTTFSGNKFLNGYVTGEWKDEIEDTNGREITTMKIVGGNDSNNSIYILFPEGK